VTAAFPPFPPVIDQTIHRTPLDLWSSLAFAAIVAASTYCAFHRKAWLLGVLAFAVPFAAYRDVGSTTITIEKCLALGTAVGLLCSGVPLIPRSRPARCVLLAGAAIMLTVALSVVHAPYPVHVAREFFKQAEYLVLFWCAATLVERTARAQHAFIYGVVASSLIVCIFAVSQAVLGGAPSGIWLNDHPLPRVAGQLEGPNQLAGFLEAALPVLWVAPVLPGFLTPARAWATGVSASAFVLTLSRTGALVTALSYAFLWRLDRARARTAALPMIIGVAFGCIVAGLWFFYWAHAGLTGLERRLLFASLQQPGGVGTRGELWRAAIALFKRDPLTGVGAGNYELLLPTVGLHGVQTQASSLWLQTLAEQGIVGLAALSAFAVVALRQTFALSKTSALSLAAFLAIASLLAHQLVDDLFFFPKVAALCWLLLGAATASPLFEVKQASPDGRTDLTRSIPVAESLGSPS